jgi:uncharacterized membrane protein
MFLILNPIAGVTAQICKYLKLEGGKNCIFMIELRIHGNVQHCKIINILFGYFLGFVVTCFDYFYSPLVFVTIVVGKLFHPSAGSVIIFALILFLFYVVMNEIRDANNELHRD